MKYKIIDAHSHLWLKQDTVVDNKPIRTLNNGRSLFMGKVRQMLPPFMIDGRNSAEVFLSNMDYAQVGAAVVTQEYIDGIQNDYLLEVKQKYPDRFFVCGMCEFRKPGFLKEAEELESKGFKAIKIPGHRLQTENGRVLLNSDEMMAMFRFMEKRGMILSIDLAEGTTQVGEMKEVIQECPQLKIAIGHRPRMARTDKACRKQECLHRVGRHNVAVQLRVLSFRRCSQSHKGGCRHGRNGETHVGIRLPADNYSHHIQDVLRLRDKIRYAERKRETHVFGRKCRKILRIHQSARSPLHQEHV